MNTILTNIFNYNSINLNIAVILFGFATNLIPFNFNRVCFFKLKFFTILIFEKRNLILFFR